MKQRNSHRNDKGKAQAGEQPVRQNTKVLCEGGLSRSSDESPVMGEERRAGVIQLKLELPTLGNRGRSGGAETKSIPGIDGESLTAFEENLEDNLYVTWNRLSSGSYHPVSVREVEIPKGDGRKRKLGIPTVRDRIAQQVVKDYLEARFEREFSEHSYGYRPLKNTHQAISQVRRNVREYRWVIDMDISNFFDTMSHELLMKAIDKHVEEKWVKTYIKRWLETSITDKQGNKRERNGIGTPQGGVISPLLANLFLHYAFDKWFGKKYPHLRFVRYADDIIVHCQCQREAEEVLEAIRGRIKACRLELNEIKTKIVYCKSGKPKVQFKTVKFEFLGFSFQPTPVLRKGVGMFLGYDCAISKKSEKKIVEIIRKSNFHRWTHSDIYRIAEYFNPKIQGWINYFGKFQKFALQGIFSIFHKRLIKWAINRYKRFKGSHRKAGKWIRQIAKSYPGIFVHWQHGFQSA